MAARYVIEAHLASSHLSPQHTSTFLPDMVTAWLRRGATWERAVDTGGWLLLTFSCADRAQAHGLAAEHRAHGWPARVTDRQAAERRF